MKTNNNIALIITIVVLLIGGYFLFKKSETTLPIVVPNDETTVSGEAVFIDKAETINFKYSKEFLASGLINNTQSWRVNTQSYGTTLAKVTIPKASQPQTNFSGAVFGVGYSKDTNEIKNCLIPTNGEIAKGTVTINGITYTKIALSDAGAGNYYDTTSYRTVRSNQCYVVEYTIHSTSIDAYSPDQGIKQFDAQKVVSSLETMVQSFRFTNTDNVTLGQVVIKPLEVVEDSRCPAGKQCIWAGTVKVKVKVTNKLGLSAESVLTLGEPKTVVGVNVTLTNISPNKTDKVLVLADYNFTFSTK